MMCDVFGCKLLAMLGVGGRAGVAAARGPAMGGWSARTAWAQGSRAAAAALLTAPIPLRCRHCCPPLPSPCRQAQRAALLDGRQPAAHLVRGVSAPSFSSLPRPLCGSSCLPLVTAYRFTACVAKAPAGGRAACAAAWGGWGASPAWPISNNADLPFFSALPPPPPRSNALEDPWVEASEDMFTRSVSPEQV